MEQLRDSKKKSQKRGGSMEVANAKAKEVATKLGTEVKEVRMLANGAWGAFFTDGKWRIVVGAPTEGIDKARAAPRGSKHISPRSALRAFNKYYKKRSSKYKTPSGIKRAMKRDMCHAKPSSKNVDTNRFRRSPRKYDYPGLDDGTKCTGKMFVSRSPSAKALAALKKYRDSLKKAAMKVSRKSVKKALKVSRKSSKKAAKVSRKSSKKAMKVSRKSSKKAAKVSPVASKKSSKRRNRKCMSRSKYYKLMRLSKKSSQKGGSQKRQSEKRESKQRQSQQKRSQRGGSKQEKKAVSLKTAVNLLRRYYAEKYQH